MIIISVTDDLEKKNKAEQLAEKMGIQIQYEKPTIGTEKLWLQMDQTGLSLAGDNLLVHGDFTRMIPRLKLNNLRGELLVRAAKKKDTEDYPLAVDATAGMGEDSLLLAAVGFRVKLYEYNPVIAALLQDTLERASEIPELNNIVAHMTLVEGDSIEALNHMETAPELVLLDPMFPARQKSALVKKKFQLLQKLEQPCTDEQDLLDAAISAKPHKIVIKRPSKGPFLAGVKPGYSIEGKGIRYDCIVLG